MIKIFGREPALWLTLVATLVKVAAAFGLRTTIDQQALINATAAAIVALIVAMVVHAGRGAALIGALQVILSLAIGFGLHVNAEQQATVMAGVAAVVGMWMRSQVTAPVQERAALPPISPTVRE